MEFKYVLVVEDSKKLNDFIASTLRKNDFRVKQALNGKEAYEALKTDTFDAIILDLKLGDTDGLSILKTIRLQNKTLPVMIVSSISDDETKIEGFRIGCDDYLTKPFMSNEMLMRIKRMIERNEQLHAPKAPVKERLVAGPFTIDIAGQSVFKNGVEIPMRKKYFDILLYLVRHQNIAIPYRTLYESVWGTSATEETTLESNLYVNINSLRKIIEDDASKPTYIHSVRHVGYLFNPGTDAPQEESDDTASAEEKSEENA